MENLSNMTKTQQRQQIANDTAEFLKSGGEFTVVAPSHAAIRRGREAKLRRFFLQYRTSGLRPHLDFDPQHSIPTNGVFNLPFNILWQKRPPTYVPDAKFVPVMKEAA